VQAVLAATKLDASTIGPRKCYDLFSDTFTWIEVFKYIINTDETPLQQYLLPNLDPQLVCTYLISNKRVQQEISWVRSNNGSCGVMAAKLANGTYVIDVFERVHGEKSQLDYDDPLYQHIISGNKEYFNLLLARFINVKRVWYGIPQTDEDQFTWSIGYIDKKNATRGHPAFYGNTILLDIGKSGYLYIQGDAIGFFNLPTGETILEYYSYLSNNTVPSAYALTQHYVYFISERIVIPRNILPAGMDWTNDFVGYFYSNSPEIQKHTTPIDYYNFYEDMNHEDRTIDFEIMDNL
jgi:hypothetical protein